MRRVKSGPAERSSGFERVARDGQRKVADLLERRSHCVSISRRDADPALPRRARAADPDRDPAGRARPRPPARRGHRLRQAAGLAAARVARLDAREPRAARTACRSCSSASPDSARWRSGCTARQDRGLGARTRSGGGCSSPRRSCSSSASWSRVVVGSYSPDVWGTEKPMDMMLINATLRRLGLPAARPVAGGRAGQLLLPRPAHGGAAGPPDRASSRPWATTSRSRP